MDKCGCGWFLFEIPVLSHRYYYAEATGSNPVEATKIFFFFLGMGEGRGGEEGTLQLRKSRLQLRW